MAENEVEETGQDSSNDPGAKTEGVNGVPETASDAASDSDRSDAAGSSAPAAPSEPAGESVRHVELTEASRTPALEVSVDHSIERAMKVLKRKLIKEGVFKELKLRRYYEKPSERRKRKHKESMKKLRKEAARNKRNAQLF